jgi:hypothetical protein
LEKFAATSVEPLATSVGTPAAVLEEMMFITVLLRNGRKGFNRENLEVMVEAAQVVVVEAVHLSLRSLVTSTTLGKGNVRTALLANSLTLSQILRELGRK